MSSNLLLCYRGTEKYQNDHKVYLNIPLEKKIKTIHTIHRYNFSNKIYRAATLPDDFISKVKSDFLKTSLRNYLTRR